jgi:DNA-binding NarL/FixJ family response regulator
MKAPYAPSMASQQRITVVIVDDFPLFLEGLRHVIASDPRFELVGEATNGEAALELIENTKPAIAVLDINLPRLSGIEIVRILESKKLMTRPVILTMVKDEQVFNQAMNLGIKGYLLKENAARDILECMASVASGQPYVSALLTSFLLRRRSRSERLRERRPSLDDLTRAERRILKAIAQTKTTKDIAAELFISPRTVESHRANICNKLELKGPNSLFQFAFEHRDALSHLV